MYIFLLFVVQGYLLVENVAADDIKTVEEKYIDMLPEGDKLAFLAKVARRIRGEKQSDVTPNTSDLVINEKQLNAQSEYVHKILNEEVETHSNNPPRLSELDNEETTQTSKDDLYKEQNVLETTTTNSEESQDYLTTTDESEVFTSTIKQESNENKDYKKTNKRKRSYRDSNEGQKSSTDFSKDGKIIKISVITVSSQDLNNYTAVETATETINSVSTDLLGMLEPLSTMKTILTDDSQTPKEQVYTTRSADVSENITIENEKEDVTLNGENIRNPLELNGSKVLRSEHNNLNPIKGTEENKNNYQVYEIDPAKKIFEKVVEVQAPLHNNQQDLAVEEPHYVPVYNYGESKAFYNAQNRLGPNVEKETVPDAHSEDAESKFLREDRDPYFLNLDYSINIPDLNDDGVSIARVPEDIKRITTKRPKHEYFDFDYYFGRNSDNSANDNDESMEIWKGTVKKKINKARLNFLYKNKVNHEVSSEKQQSNDDDDNSNQKMSLTKLNTDEDENLEAYVVVVNDMITTNNEELRIYDWLGSTVDILSAIEKLTELIKHKRSGIDLHRSDEQLLRYIEYLHGTAISMEPAIQNGGPVSSETEIQNGGSVPSKTVYQNGGDPLPKFLRDIAKMYAERLSSSDDGGDELQQNWVEVSNGYGSDIDTANYENGDRKYDDRLEKLLLQLTKELSPLHNAISDIAASAAYDNQNWFGNLRKTYLKVMDREKSIKVLLHVMACALLDQIEESAGNGIEDDFQKYIRTRHDDVNRTVEQFRLVLKLLNLLNS